MLGLAAGTPRLLPAWQQGVDGWDKPGHDGVRRTR